MIAASEICPTGCSPDRAWHGATRDKPSSKNLALAHAAFTAVDYRKDQEDDAF
jgi:hypothetical protein